MRLKQANTLVPMKKAENKLNTETLIFVNKTIQTSRSVLSRSAMALYLFIFSNTCFNSVFPSFVQLDEFF